jgi:hypothetical protein
VEEIEWRWSKYRFPACAAPESSSAQGKGVVFHVERD